MFITESDLRKAAKLILKLSPSKDTYDRYERTCREFIEHLSLSKRKKSTGHILKASMYSSKFFKRKYFILSVDQVWFDQIAPHCDAVATSSLSHLGTTAPPLVVVPGSGIPKSRKFKSVLEHEIVHVNQALLSEFPNLDACTLQVKQIFPELMSYTKMEFEANFIQLAYDQTLAPPAEFGLSLDEWSHLRGFTGGLETILFRMMKEGSSDAKLNRLVNKMRKDLPAAFRSISLSEAIGRKYAIDIDRLVDAALTNVHRAVRTQANKTDA